jgi:histidyl-tRNA synthetase
MSKKIIQNVKGMRDILPADQPYWEKVGQRVKETAEFYNFLKIDTPIVEFAKLFEQPLGETSDVVEKQMFFVKSKSGDRLVLRPEATAPIVRAYIQHGLSHLGQPLKLYYQGPMFRYEQPQAGRLRQLHQAGFEIISGDDDPIYDVQVMLAAVRTLEALKIKNIAIHLNSIGCRICRPTYRKKLLDYYKNKEKEICADCRRRFKINPLRLLDCKNSECVEIKGGAPIFLDSLCAFCKRHFKLALEYAEELNLPYVLNHYLARGFDYYTQTVFEIFSEAGETALVGGGRYNYLAALLGGRSSPGVGAGLGLDRIIDFLKAQNISFGAEPRHRFMLVHIGDLAKKRSLSIIEDLRRAKIDVLEYLSKESFKAQLRNADKLQIPYVLIFGQQEAFEDSIIVRDMKTGAQDTVPLKKLVDKLKRIE